MTMRLSAYACCFQSNNDRQHNCSPLAYTNSQYMNSHDNGSLVLEWWNFAGKIFSQWKEKKEPHRTTDSTTKADLPARTREKSS